MGRAFSREESEQQIRFVLIKHCGAIGLLTKWNNSRKEICLGGFLVKLSVAEIGSVSMGELKHTDELRSIA